MRPVGPSVALSASAALGPLRPCTMDLLPDNESDHSDNDSAQESGENIEVGVRVLLPHFQARAAGDDMSWKGSKTLRAAALQAGGVGTPHFIGRWWGTSLSQLGADIGCVSEIGFTEENSAPSLVQGFAAAGYNAIFHGPGRGASDTHAGLAVVVRRNIVPEWSVISKDRAGRCLSGTLHLSSGLPIRVIGVYSITGGSLPGFERDAAHVSSESQLVQFIRDHSAGASHLTLQRTHC